MQFDDFVSRLDGVRRHPDGSITARCPAHEDDRSSLSVKRGNRVQIIAYCHAGCDFHRIIRAAEFCTQRRTR